MFVKPVFATCPVCVVAVGGGLAIAERLGVDTLIAAVWIGALITSVATAFKNKLRGTIIFYLLTLGFLKLQGKLNNPYCKIWGVCKIWLGITVGTVVFWLGVLFDRWLRTKNDGKVFFPFQKVACPLIAVLLFTLIFNFLIC